LYHLGVNVNRGLKTEASADTRDVQNSEITAVYPYSNGSSLRRRPYTLDIE